MNINKLLLILAAFPLACFAQRETKDLTDNNWEITVDKNAPWWNDKLFVAPADADKLPLNIPTGGWGLLNSPQKRNVHLPATVEGELWGMNGQTFGITGNYVGVSWFRTETDVPASWKGKQIKICFGAARFRAEVFVNHKLCGYNLVNSTPFDCDISNVVLFGQKNEIAVRITDPNGNFNWKDSQCYAWGDYLTNPSHGFGGITGDVRLLAVDNNHIEDVFIENTPQPNLVKVHVEADVARNDSLPLTVTVKEHISQQTVFTSRCYMDGSGTKTLNVNVVHAKLWSVDSPFLYDMTLTLGNDIVSKRFGFRWFEIKTINGDRQFFLNGKRIVLRTAISWSFWPDNGLAPTPELAVKQVADAKALGLNMLNFHRMIGNPLVLDAADELGLLYFEEPGGNQYPAGRFNDGSLSTQTYFEYRNEKLKRMIRRDRSHPSLIIYNLHNERGAEPQAEDFREMTMAHKLDPSRILTYNSCNGSNPEGTANKHFKTHLLPLDSTFHYVGWWDNHHAGGPGVYHDNLYNGPDNYLRFSGNKPEIVYWGEEGAIGTPPRLQLIRDHILKSGNRCGWEADDYLAWYDAYDRFIKERGFGKAFPCVDSLTRQMGNVAYYYQGRVIENIRICNTVDAYAINGWESMKLENHSGIVDNYRNLKGDPWLIAYYNRPLYLAVKLNRKVMAVGDTTTADVYIVNEKNIHGKALLRITAVSPTGEKCVIANKHVTINGGNTYGEMLASGLHFVVPTEGYTDIRAELFQNRSAVTTGQDRVFAVKVDAEGIGDGGLIADTTGTIQDFIRTLGIKMNNYCSGRPNGKYLIVGAFEPTQFGSGFSDILEWVNSGHTLIIVDNPERWAEFLADKEVLDYRGCKPLGTSWYGGKFFLPQA
jgi:beta-galactosidase